MCTGLTIEYLVFNHWRTISYHILSNLTNGEPYVTNANQLGGDSELDCYNVGLLHFLALLLLTVVCGCFVIFPLLLGACLVGGLPRLGLGCVGGMFSASSVSFPPSSICSASSSPSVDASPSDNSSSLSVSSPSLCCVLGSTRGLTQDEQGKGC